MTPLRQMTVAALVSDYVDHVESQGRQRTTVARYRLLLRSNIEPSLATTRISSLRGSLLNDFYAKLRAQGLSDTTVAHVHGLLTATFRWGRRCGRTDRDPMIGVDRPRRSRSSARAMRPEDARADSTGQSNTSRNKRAGVAYGSVRKTRFVFAAKIRALGALEAGRLDQRYLACPREEPRLNPRCASWTRWDRSR